MKTRIYLIIIALIAVSMLTAQVYAKNDNGRKKPKSDTEDKIELRSADDGNSQNYIYVYKGKYKNFDDDNHVKRFYFRGKYYPFQEYYGLYYQESNAYTYEGSYGRNGNIFIFTDRYGNEFDLYVRQVEKLPPMYNGYPLKYGHTYELKLRPEKFYPARESMKVGVSLNFGWGVLHMEKEGYYDLHNSPNLINHRGKLYIK
jgi:hypothetical protein